MGVWVVDDCLEARDERLRGVVMVWGVFVVLKVELVLVHGWWTLSVEAGGGMKGRVVKSRRA